MRLISSSTLRSLPFLLCYGSLSFGTPVVLAPSLQSIFGSHVVAPNTSSFSILLPVTIDNPPYTIPGTGNAFCFGNFSVSIYRTVTDGACSNGGGGSATGNGTFTLTRTGTYPLNLSYYTSTLFQNHAAGITIGVCSRSNGVTYTSTCIPVTCTDSSTCSASGTYSLTINN